jgi:ornithine cyclodeaminase/alanine dehydrogenase-like protein (mu-crystallin family)
MKIINFETILSLNIHPKICIEWVKNAFLIKESSVLPPKNSIKQEHNVFFNTMPCLIRELGRFGVKEVSRFPQRNPALCSEILLYDSNDGSLLSIMDGSWITAFRTGAVAALAIQTFKSKNARNYAFLGLGNTARTTLLCLLESITEEQFNIKLLAYKGQEKIFIDRFANYSNVHFEVVSSVEELFSDSDVIVSCITATDTPLASDDLFKEGVLVVPVHTRGFQNCDLFFDKIFADDEDHVKGFQYFNHFKKFDEFSNVLLGKFVGRESDNERILSYNIGIALHDIYFASKIYDMLSQTGINNVNLFDEKKKFWI